MSQYRNHLPQLGDALFITDGGVETTLIFHEGIPLPCFESFDLLKNEAGRAVLRRCYTRYAEIARSAGVGIVLETPTWRANADWGAKLGYDAAALADANRKAVDLLLGIRDEFETAHTPVVISGNLGPRGDGYRAAARMSSRQAHDYHAAQIETFARTEADMVAAFTMNYIGEAVGIVHAARAACMPVAISFTLETDGRLPSGDTLERAITQTDDETGGYPAYYMINCAHPTHFHDVLTEGGAWRERLRGLRANASKRSHAELDENPDLDIGNPAELGLEYRELRALLPRLSVVGGCCGTDHRHVGAICAALA
ncbi:MAG: homocysteine S-methyltransferase family protein [Burkholderiales bacterium]|nr:homocysteine S-methyltransferase family protein [Burkholderiales bacterium]